MTVGRKESTPSYFAEEGYYGRMPPAPDGRLFVRDPAEARARAIREKVALIKRQGGEIPEHLQMLFDTLPPKKVDNRDVDLVDALTGTQVGEVTVKRPNEVEPTPLVDDEAKLEPQASDEPHVPQASQEAEAVTKQTLVEGGAGGIYGSGGSGALDVEAAEAVNVDATVSDVESTTAADKVKPVEDKAPAEEKAAPKSSARRGRPRKAQTTEE